MAVKTDAIAALIAKAAKKDIRVGTLATTSSDVQFLDTGNMAVNYVMGGGVPMRRSVEFSGPPSCGKTTITLQTCVELQKVIIAGGDPERGIGPDDVILYADFESTLDQVYAEKLGLNIEHKSFLLVQPDTLEDGANLINEFFETGLCRLAVVDSVSGMNPSVKAEAEVGKSLPGVTARLLKEWGVGLNSILRNNNGTVIFINHEIQKFDMGGGRPGMPAPVTTPGGIALKFFASVRVQFKQVKNYMGEIRDPLTGEKVKRPLATDVTVKALKNKVANPFRQALVRVRYGRGFDNFYSAMQVLTADKKIMVSGAYHYFHNVEEAGFAPTWMPRSPSGVKRPYIMGENKVFKAAQARPEWRDGLISMAEGIIKNNVRIMQAADTDDGVLDDDKDDADELDVSTGELSEKRVDFSDDI